MTIEEQSAKTRDGALLQIGFAMGMVQVRCTPDDRDRFMSIVLSQIPFDVVSEFVDGRRAQQPAQPQELP